MALCFQCVRNTKELSQCETQTAGILSHDGEQTVIRLPIMHRVRDQGSGLLRGDVVAVAKLRMYVCMFVRQDVCKTFITLVPFCGLNA